METNMPAAATGSKAVRIILIVVVLAVLLGVLWWLSSKNVSVPAPVAVPGTVNQPTQDLGSTLYNSASNPVSGKLPDTVAPVPNPIGGFYKNPF